MRFLHFHRLFFARPFFHGRWILLGHFGGGRGGGGIVLAIVGVLFIAAVVAIVRTPAGKGKDGDK